MGEIVTPDIVSGLHRGEAFGAGLPARQTGYLRHVAVYPVARREASGTQAGGPAHYRVICYETGPQILYDGDPAMEICSDHNVVHVDDIGLLEQAILTLAGHRVVLVKLVRPKIVIREEPGNWRIEFNGFLQASSGSQGGALSFAYALAQQEYECTGVAARIFLAEHGRETNLRWEPANDWRVEDD